MGEETIGDSGVGGVRERGNDVGFRWSGDQGTPDQAIRSRDVGELKERGNEVEDRRTGLEHTGEETIGDISVGEVRDRENHVEERRSKNKDTRVDAIRDSGARGVRRRGNGVGMVSGRDNDGGRRGGSPIRSTRRQGKTKQKTCRRRCSPTKRHSLPHTNTFLVIRKLTFSPIQRLVLLE